MTVMEISERTPVLMERLLAVWERSVRATHAFLSQEEILRIRQYVPEALARVPLLVTAETAPGRPAAFMGLEGRSLEMLFWTRLSGAGASADGLSAGEWSGTVWTGWPSMSRIPRPWGFTATWALRCIKGRSGTSRAARTRCCTCACRAPSERGRRRAPPGPRRRLVGCKVFGKAAQAVPFWEPPAFLNGTPAGGRRSGQSPAAVSAPSRRCRSSGSSFSPGPIPRGHPRGSSQRPGWRCPFQSGASHWGPPSGGPDEWW